MRRSWRWLRRLGALTMLTAMLMPVLIAGRAKADWKYDGCTTTGAFGFSWDSDTGKWNVSLVSLFAPCEGPTPGSMTIIVTGTADDAGTCGPPAGGTFRGMVLSGVLHVVGQGYDQTTAVTLEQTFDAPFPGGIIQGVTYRRGQIELPGTFSVVTRVAGVCPPGGKPKATITLKRTL